VSATWIPASDTDDKLLRCTVHPKVKPWRRDAAGGCAKCAAAPRGKSTAPIAVEHPDETPIGCRSLVEHERWFTELAIDLSKKADAQGNSAKSIGAAAKLYDVALKAARAAAELAYTRTRTRTTSRREKLAREILAAKDRAKRGVAN
jgi:hypothetical protein